MTTTLQPSRFNKILATSIPPWVLWLMLASVVGSAIALAWWNKPPPGPLLEKFNKVQMGMTQQEVEGLFGFSADNSKAVYFFVEDRKGPKAHIALEFRKVDTVIVLFDSDDRVVGKKYYVRREDIPH